MPGHRFVVRGIRLFGDQLTIHYAWVPGLTVDYSEGDIYPNIRYDADVQPDNSTDMGSYAPCEGGPYTDGKIQYAQPPAEARYAFFDFFRPDYDCDGENFRGTADEEYLANRVSRLTVELRTGRAVLES